MNRYACLLDQTIETGKPSLHTMPHTDSLSNEFVPSCVFISAKVHGLAALMHACPAPCS